jgi:hypothetical protein
VKAFHRERKVKQENAAEEEQDRKDESHATSLAKFWRDAWQVSGPTSVVCHLRWPGAR